MRELLNLALVAFLALASGVAFGQTACPHGVTPGSSQCLPSGAGAANVPPPPRARWIQTWGAMAEGARSSKVGTASGETSRRAAERAAVKKCESMGGIGCRPVFAYRNTCAVIAEPVDLLQMMVGYYQHAPTVEEARVWYFRVAGLATRVMSVVSSIRTAPLQYCSDDASLDGWCVAER